MRHLAARIEPEPRTGEIIPPSLDINVLRQGVVGGGWAARRCP